MKLEILNSLFTDIEILGMGIWLFYYNGVAHSISDHTLSNIIRNSITRAEAKKEILLKIKPL